MQKRHLQDFEMAASSLAAAACSGVSLMAFPDAAHASTSAAAPMTIDLTIERRSIVPSRCGSDRGVKQRRCGQIQRKLPYLKIKYVDILYF
jgi:hypothetical protein